MKRRWFQFHLSTALVLTVTAGALLGMNITPRGELNRFLPALKIGTGDSTVPISAYYVRDYWGWPWEWHRNDPKIATQQLVSNIAFSVGILFFTWLSCEFWTRRIASRTSAASSAARLCGLSVRFLMWLSIVTIAGALTWSNLVLHISGPLACRGWPLPFEAYVRADAAIGSWDMAVWRRANEMPRWCMALNGFTAVAGIGVICGAAKWYKRFATRSEGN